MTTKTTTPQSATDGSNEFFRKHAPRRAGVWLAATGHRPDKLQDVRPRKLAYLAGMQIKLDLPEVGISGMALGWDTVWAQACLELGIPLIAAVPFEGQEARWSSDEKRLYCEILKRAAEVIYLSPPGYQPWKFHVRNRWMVDNCTKLVALWNGSPGGTANSVAYAEKVGREVVNLWERL